MNTDEATAGMVIGGAMFAADPDPRDAQPIRS
jgi:hypothetical protein